MNRRTLIFVCAMCFLAVSVSAGPVLDDVLNYMFRDQSTPFDPKYEWFLPDNAIQLTRGEPIGQTFTTGPECAKIVRIRCKIVPNSDWQPGEGVEMVLWDSPQKNTALGRYTIWYEFRGYKFGEPQWEVRADVSPNTLYYFELSYVGEGDGRLSKVEVMNGRDAYPVGQGYLSGKEADFDVCFQTHVKRPMDRIGNLRKAFARFDLNLTQLAEVKEAVDREDFDTAIARLVAYFEARKEPTPVIAEHKPFEGFDIREADLALRNYFQSSELGKGYGGPDINWAGEPDFNEDGTIKASFWNTGMNRFGPRGPLTKGYLATGDDKYAKKLNDVLIDWYLDNPPPGVSGLGGDGSDPIWATLQCGARLAANFIAYSRIAKSPGFTLDCRMAYLLNLADEADTLVLNGAGDGGNWSFMPNVAMFEFAVNFPEYKSWMVWRDAASERLAGTIKKDILPDGVETEAAPGYQRMSYNPLVSLHRTMLERNVQTPFSHELKSILEKQAEYFMYLTMPNGITPYFGDWGNTQERDPLRADSELFERPDMLYVATAGKGGGNPAELSKIYPYFGVLMMRSDWGDSANPFEDARYLFMHGLRRGAHGHADLNAITCYAYGRELLADPGAYEYGGPEHAYLMTSQAHNLMTINGENGRRHLSTRWNYLGTSPVADYISSWADSYESGDYNREVFFIRANGDPGARDYWIVRDTAGGEGTQSLEQRWHLAPGPSHFNEKTLTARSVHPTGGNLSIMQIDPSRLACEQSTTRTWPRGSGGEELAMPNFVYRIDTPLPAAIDTVLFPSKGSQPPTARMAVVEKSEDGLDTVFKIIHGRTQDLFVLQRSPGHKSVSTENVVFDGERLYLRRVNGKLRSALLVNGRNLMVDGEPVISGHRDLLVDGKVIVNPTEPISWVSVTFGSSGARAYTGREQPHMIIWTGDGSKVTVTNTGLNAVIEPANQWIEEITRTHLGG